MGWVGRIGEFQAYDFLLELPTARLASRDPAQFFAADLQQIFAAQSLQREPGGVADKKIACQTSIPMKSFKNLVFLKCWYCW